MPSPKSPSLPSFRASLSDATLQLLFEDDFFSPRLYLVFGAGGFPVEYVSVNNADVEIALQEVFSVKNELSLADCHEYNQWVRRTGRVPVVPENLSTVCLKQQDPNTSHCRALSKWLCRGCGRVWVPGSLRDRACVVHEDPWWAAYLTPSSADIVAMHGGVSKTDPLIWFADGIHRHGRTITHNPEVRND